MRPADTAPEAYAIQLAVHRRLGAAGRFRAAIEMSDFAHALAEAGFRARYPECPESVVPRRLAEILYLRKRP